MQGRVEQRSSCSRIWRHPVLPSQALSPRPPQTIGQAWRRAGCCGTKKPMQQEQEVPCTPFRGPSCPVDRQSPLGWKASVQEQELFLGPRISQTIRQDWGRQGCVEQRSPRSRSCKGPVFPSWTTPHGTHSPVWIDLLCTGTGTPGSLRTPQTKG